MTPPPVPARRRWRLLPALLATACALTTPVHADDKDITWLINYDGKALPDSTWKVVGTPKSSITSEGLNLVDDGTGIGHFRTAWKAEPAQEIIVEATVKVLTTTGSVKGKTTSSLWPWRDGAPISMLVGDGKHEEGLVLFPNQATSHTDRFIPMDTTNRFHTYRLVIRGSDMSMLVDDQTKVEGQNAFWRAASSAEPFIQFGSSSERATGSAIWQSVKLGVRKMTTAPKADPIKLTISEPWLIEREDIRQTRPYLYDMGKGLLLMSAAQGKDFFYEPYGLLKSTDAGKTWTPIPGLDKVDTTPLPCLRRPDGSILAVSRWTRLQPDGSVTGKTVHLNADATSFTMIDNVIHLPKQYANEVKTDQTICERHIWNDTDGGVTMVLWSRKGVKRPDGRNNTERWSHLMRSTDEGKTWNYFSTVGPGGEPSVVRLSDTEQTAVIRGDRDACMKQMFSSDGGKTWSKPIALEVGKVLPDLFLMSNGVLACSYGRPASCLMFSLDGGKTWPSHHVLSEKVGFNYTSIREISPGRLLYIHDAPKMSGIYVDVERVK
ncbi:sialidase family protein [Brevifollis gellanilyticus]|nr:sialidase family protein [Brevifollis gellanilyticus]